MSDPKTIAGDGAESLRAHYAALRGALATDPSDARATRVLVLARLEARAERQRERRHAIFSCVVALGCAMCVGVPTAWALSRALARSPVEPTVLPSLGAARPDDEASRESRDTTAARAQRTPPSRATYARRRGRAAGATQVAAAHGAVLVEALGVEAPRVEAPELAPAANAPVNSMPLGDPSPPSVASAAPVEERPGRAEASPPPASYTRAIDLVRRMHDADAEPLLRSVIADTHSPHWRREAARVLELLLARRASQEALAASQ